MKTKIMVLLALVLCLALVCCACNAPEGDDPGGETNGEGETPPEGNDDGNGESVGMARINIFQTGIVELETEDVESKGSTVAAYSVQDYITKNFAAAPVNPVVMVASDGYAASTQVDEFTKLFITLEGENAPLPVGPEISGELSVKFLRYVKTANESICFVEDALEVSDIFETLEMVEADSYKFVAADGFAFEVAAADIGECSLYKSETSVNATLAGLTGGDLRDVLYIEAVQ